MPRPRQFVCSHDGSGQGSDQAANGVWLTDHVPPGYLSGWSG